MMASLAVTEAVVSVLALARGATRGHEGERNGSMPPSCQCDTMVLRRNERKKLQEERADLDSPDPMDT
jgi:hypothetical protein